DFDSNSDCYSHTNSDSYANTNIHSPAYSDSKAGTYWKTSPNPTPSAVAGDDELVERIILRKGACLPRSFALNALVRLTDGSPK
ncbi:MAG: hypothetical protein WA849_13890, partial [Candidatus Udaeobacter sp.]